MVIYKYAGTEHIFDDKQGYMGAFNNGRKIGHGFECQNVKIVKWQNTTPEIDKLFTRLGFEKIVD